LDKISSQTVRSFFSHAVSDFFTIENQPEAEEAFCDTLAHLVTNTRFLMLYADQALREMAALYPKNRFSAAASRAEAELLALAIPHVTAPNDSRIPRMRSRGRKKRKQLDPEVAKRRLLVGSNPGITAQEMCRIFDRCVVPLPPKWQEAGFRLWTAAYRNPKYRSRIDVIIAKDKRTT